MKNLAIVYGGNSLEHDISIITALYVMEELEKKKVKYIPLYLSRDGVFYTGKALLNKDNYEQKKKFIKGQFIFKDGYYQYKYKHKLVEIDCAVLCVHGAGVEDGTLKAYFDLLKIPSTSSSVLNSAVIQDKYFSKILLENAKVSVVPGYKLTKYDKKEVKEGFSYPLIIKPTHLGSSIGVKKVTNEEEFLKQLDESFNYDDSVLVEQAIENLKELNIAILGEKGDYVVSQIELVNMQNKILTFSDKYELFQSKYEGHVVPAKITSAQENAIKEMAKKAFELFDCKGVVRFDFFLDVKNKKIYLNEINSIPGSLAFYLFKNLEISMYDILQRLVRVAKNEYNFKRHLIREYQYSNLKKLTHKK